MEFLPLPVTMMMCSMPEATHSSATYWICGLSTTVSISLGWALVAGRKRVPRPAAGRTALRTLRTGVAGVCGICWLVIVGVSLGRFVFYSLALFHADKPRMTVPRVGVFVNEA